MKNILFILMSMIISLGYSQQLQIYDTSKTSSMNVAEDNSFYIIKNEISLIIDDNVKRKIELHRKYLDYIWKPEDGVEILIYKK